MGIAKLITKKIPRKTLTTTIKHKGGLRIKEINKKLKENTSSCINKMSPKSHAQEVFDIYEGKWKGKK